MSHCAEYEGRKWGGKKMNCTINEQTSLQSKKTAVISDEEKKLTLL